MNTMSLRHGGIFRSSRGLNVLLWTDCEETMKRTNQGQYKGMILENTFLSLPDVIDYHFPKLKTVLKCVIRNVWASKDRIPRIKIPIFFVICK